MKIPPRYSISPEILSLLSKVEVNRQFVSLSHIPEAISIKLRRISLLKSAVYSARIEGNSLTPEEVEFSDDQLQKVEIENIISAYDWILKTVQVKTNISRDMIKRLHFLTMKNIFTEAGRFRKEMGAIYNKSGVAVYISPPPEKIPNFLGTLLDYVNNQDDEYPLVKALITHLIFEKIHPFIDGNGRVGRLIISLVLTVKGYDFGLGLPYEQFLDEHKSDYYYYLGNGLTKTDEYLKFMLQAFFEETEQLKKQIAIEMNKIIILPPRQEEIYDVIKDHRVVSFDFIQRRFVKVPARTLRYDLKKLCDQNLVHKIGKTKGSFYKAI
ncbi:hypothetical protein A2866_01140 [Candidatus Roizmanbacteria bacterium RIFCSPHIGHO2_01_FULL_39_8]|uniref:Fido domain-containing protein n=3 Tax=Candidatus Roizmaniibacteriota TaxID=1752723 RepID=A0A1F7GM40_9BACT|nr:MAG: hypothetical protein A2866_01140 [Candidatus Roizmanbacteria bacterium RIFCSPHIGHO2_01_FULL_39_8]OGK25538.1 MAG: hypothetical protein A3C28_01630 [Candidatus Roizmanbacteria bacterium RIFCSPHIGHO2_02_FULL_39_9]OGK35070.1 MAG: hypothetical protein A3F60_03230 [Candidatus Roizmanbacteria bacterium RIFCSPHIGHO2_12_FULL_39_8]